MSHKRKPTISVITVVFNDVHHLEQTILSVLNQTYLNIEYILIDGGSTDGTMEIINKYKKNISFWISEHDNGIYDAMNKGIDVASGDWINFMNSGDKFFNNKVVESIFDNNININTDIIFGNVCKDSRFIKAKKISRISTQLPFCHQSSFVRSCLLKKYHFNINYQLAADYDFFYFMYKNNKKFFHINECISSFYSGGASSDIIQLLKEYRKIQIKYNPYKINIIQNMILLREMVKSKISVK